MTGERVRGWFVPLAAMTGIAILAWASIGAAPETRAGGITREARQTAPRANSSSSRATIPAAIGWYDVPGTKLESVCPPDGFKGIDYPFASRCSGVIREWSSGIADTRRNRLILWGGGHNGYAGNELYAFELDTMQLRRLNDPSPIAACQQATPDGRANTRHTYGGLAYIAHADRMFVFGGVPYCPPAGNSSSDTWTLNLENLEWKRMDPVRGGGPSGYYNGTVSAYDAASKLVFVQDRKTGFWSYDFDTNTYRYLNNHAALTLHTNAVIDVKAELFLTFGDGKIQAISIASRSHYSQQDRSKAQGCDGLSQSVSPGLAYDSVLDRIVGWPDFGATVFLYDSKTNSCTTQTLAGSSPEDSAHTGGPGTSNGTFGRFQFFPASDVFALANDWNIDIHTLRLPSPGSESASMLPGR
ncbi:MAG: kelch repeat-containing protein [Candidatus Acidiferrales bacterium]